MKLISIIVPVYNADRTVNRCIESILAQTHRDLELILVDDGSTDGSAAILDAYAKKDDRVRVIHTQNKGVSSARNTGLALARGDFIGFADADDHAEADMYERLLSLIEAEQADISVCSFFEEHADMQPAPPFTAGASTEVRTLSAKQAYEMALEQSSFRGFLWNKLFRAVYFTKEGHHIRLDETVHICEDLLCFCQCLCRAQKIVYDPIRLYHYTVSETSASNSIFSVRKATLLDARRKIVELTRQSFPQLSGNAGRLYVTDTVYMFILALHSGSDTASLRRHAKYIRKHILSYLFGKGARLDYRLMAAAICVSPRAANALWRLIKGKTRGNA